ncbi:MAG: SdiA-regulated domain-containing protein [Zoogloeaceae bacterium]|jgi:uncharacterized protein YjiK|nr:SdiA-regulated domain-containing protein [Zoogloeaceae bacterium]
MTAVFRVSRGLSCVRRGRHENAPAFFPPQQNIRVDFCGRGAIDVEGITWIGKNRYILADERDQTLYWIAVDAQTESVGVARAHRLRLSVRLGGSRKFRPENYGFEGVVWDDAQHRLFVAKGKRPPRIFRMEGDSLWHAAAGVDLSIYEWWPKNGLIVDDISTLGFYAGHLLVLSDESKTLMEYSGDSKLISMMPLWRGWQSLERAIPQPEGIAVDHEEKIYILSEPNLFYRFERQ